MSESDVIITGYSFKGGSGRTTAAVNIAGALMCRGKKVVTIDMDFGSPGMRTILYRSFFGREFKKYISGLDEASSPFDHVQFNDKGIHEFLNGAYTDPNKYISECAFDYWREWSKERNPSSNLDSADKTWTTSGSIVSEQEQKIIERRDEQSVTYFNPILGADFDDNRFWVGEALFLPGSSHERNVSLLTQPHRKFRVRFELLQEAIREYFRAPKDEIIYYILDSASGVTSYSLPVLRLADVLLIFFRWSLQHFYGTKENVRILDAFLSDSRTLGMRMFIVGNCAPTRSYMQYIMKSKHPHLESIADWYKKETDSLRVPGFSWNYIEYLEDIFDEVFLRFNETLMMRDLLRPSEGAAEKISVEEVEIHKDNIRQFHSIAKRLIGEAEQIVYEREQRRRAR